MATPPDQPIAPDPFVKGDRFSVQVLRPHARVALIEASAPGVQEFFYVVEGEASVAITVFDATDQSYREPSVYVLPRPYRWTMALSDEDLLIQLWRAVGIQR